MLVVCECLHEQEACGRHQCEGDEECCGDVRDLGRCEVLVEWFGFSLCLSLGLGLSSGVSGGWMEVYISSGWVRVFL